PATSPPPRRAPSAAAPPPPDPAGPAPRSSPRASATATRRDAPPRDAPRSCPRNPPRHRDGSTPPAASSPSPSLLGFDPTATGPPSVPAQGQPYPDAHHVRVRLPDPARTALGLQHQGVRKAPHLPETGQRQRPARPIREELDHPAVQREHPFTESVPRPVAVHREVERPQREPPERLQPQRHREREPRSRARTARRAAEPVLRLEDLLRPRPQPEQRPPLEEALVEPHLHRPEAVVVIATDRDS